MCFEGREVGKRIVCDIFKLQKKKKTEAHKFLVASYATTSHFVDPSIHQSVTLAFFFLRFLASPLLPN